MNIIRTDEMKLLGNNVNQILILTAGFGEGHNSAARQIAAGLKSVSNNDEIVEIHDLFAKCYGSLNELMKSGYAAAIQKAPALWRGVYRFVDGTRWVDAKMSGLGRLRKGLEELLLTQDPDAVITTYPLYDMMIKEIYREGRTRKFPVMTVVTDSISINSVWYRGESDCYYVPNALTAEVMERAGVSSNIIKNLGFPVSPVFSDDKLARKRQAPSEGKLSILYMANNGRKKSLKIIEKLLEHPEWNLTICAGRDVKLAQEIERMIGDRQTQVRLMGWTQKMPELMMSHHVVITKAGGATIQEAIAAKTPLIVTKVVPGQEEGNWLLVEKLNVGCFAEKGGAVIKALENLLEDDAAVWHQWHQNLCDVAKPDSACEIAKDILEVCRNRSEGGAPSITKRASDKPRLLVADFHTHTTYSDGVLTLEELVDMYGSHGIDCLCVTDHWCDPERLMGKICNRSGLVLTPDKVESYFEDLQRQKKRALDKYGMILLGGLEFNKDGYTAKTSAHLLGIDLTAPIDPSLDLKEIIGEIHRQGALAVASHPHESRSPWGKNTLYLWEHQEEFIPLLDAWEIANRDDIFNPVGLKKLPFIANSDFHKPKHLYSWKTVLYCEKEPEAIKACIRANRDVSITLYRNHLFGRTLP